MEISDYFNSWCHKYKGITLVLLFLMLFTGMAQFASFALIQHQVISLFGAQVQDVSLSFQLTYAGILITLPLHFRFIKRYQARSYLLIALIAGILLNLGCLHTSNILVFMVLRFFTGISTCAVAGTMLMSVLSILPEKIRMITGFFIFFNFILIVGILTGIPAAFIVERMDWPGLYYFLILFQVVSIIICLLVYKAKNLKRLVPLYQIDFTGTVFFAVFGITLAYLMIYGPRYYWFSDSRILFSALLSAIFLILLLHRQLKLKRPLIDLRVFQYKKFWFALFILITFYGLRDTINLLYGYAVGILGWSTVDVIKLGLLNVLGVIISAFITARIILKNKKLLPVILIIGFLIMLYYDLWVYWNLTNNLSFNNLIFPICAQGVASGMLFSPIIILCMGSVPTFTGMTAVVVCTCARFITSLNSITGFYTLQEKYRQESQLGYIENITPYNSEFTARTLAYKNLFITKGFNTETASNITNKLIGKNIGIQSQILTDLIIFKISAIAIAVVIVSLIAFILLNIYQAKRKNIPV